MLSDDLDKTIREDSGDGTSDRTSDAARRMRSRTVPDLTDPATIGPFKIIRRIGEGGMGVVYEGKEEHPVRRRAAIKVVPYGKDTREIVARFEDERQALALMHHPNIAILLDPGDSGEGGPRYFAMEYIDGPTITEFCSREMYGLHARLYLFIKACEGVQHAHKKGVIHRDLKPSNILVDTADDEAVPKVIDFGIAKALGGRLTASTLLTAAGTPIGTLAYMSPEQAWPDEQVGVDTRSDVYSLGVILYELLTGSRPFSSAKTFDEIRKAIKEKLVPAPSAHLSSLESQRGRDVGSSGSTEERSEDTSWPIRSKEIQKDIDWIVLRALDKEPDHRYQSVADLAADILRFLHEEPVAAGPHSKWYRLRKLVRRRRKGVAAVVIGVTVMIGVLVVVKLLASQAAIAKAEKLGKEAESADKQFWAAKTKWEESNRNWRDALDPDQMWMLPWENLTVVGYWKDLGRLEKEIENSYNEAFLKWSNAIELVPQGSACRGQHAGSLEDFLMRCYRDPLPMGGRWMSPTSILAEVQRIGLNTFKDEIAGSGDIVIETEPRGASAYCFRYEEVEQRLLPLSFDPETEKVVGEPILRVAEVWCPAWVPFQKGDIIYEVNGRRTKTYGDLADALLCLRVSSEVSVGVLRGECATRLPWVPWPIERHWRSEPSRVLPFFESFGMTFEGYPLDFEKGSLISSIPEYGSVHMRLPRGSYLILLRCEGYADTRYPIVMPRDAGEHRVRLLEERSIPPGFAYVPKGEFVRGSSRGNAFDSVPEEVASCESFLLSKFEVTRADYQEFLNDSSISSWITAQGTMESAKLSPEAWAAPELKLLMPENKVIDMVPLVGSNERIYRLEKSSWKLLPALDPKIPVFRIPMAAAVEYAYWRTQKCQGAWHFRLPTQMEWEKAARGADGRSYVWGDYLALSHCCSLYGASPRSSVYKGIASPVGAFPLDESVFGIRDLNGSVTEPTMSSPGKRRMFIWCGGSKDSTVYLDYHLATRNASFSYTTHSYLGIRLAADVPLGTDGRQK